MGITQKKRMKKLTPVADGLHSDDDFSASGNIVKKSISRKNICRLFYD